MNTNTRGSPPSNGDSEEKFQFLSPKGNIYTLIGDLNSALEYHGKHLEIARELKDRIGESRAYLSLSNCHQVSWNL